MVPSARCLKAEFLSYVNNLNLQSLVIRNELRHLIMISAPAVSDLVVLTNEHLLILLAVKVVEDLIKLRLDFRWIVFQGVGFDPVMHVHLFLNIGILDFVIGLDWLLEDFVLVLHGDPLKLWHELVNSFIDFIFV